MAVKEQVSLPSQRICSRCKFVSSQEVCKACILLEGLNKGLPKLGIGKSSKAKRMLEEYARNKGEEQLNQAVSELNDDIDIIDNTICGTKYRSCKSCSCKNGNKETCQPNIDENKDSINNMTSDKCTDKCSNRCNGHVSQDNNEIQSESKINRLLEEFSIEESDKSIDDTCKVLHKKKNEKNNSIEELLKEDESCVGGCEGMAISF